MKRTISFEQIGSGKRNSVSTDEPILTQGTCEDQSQVIAFLADPASYGRDVRRVEQIQTHISIVFLAGERAYKLKRAVKYPYLDFSTVKRRGAACEAELRLNRRTAPTLYLEVRALIRDEDGALGWAGAGEVVDWVVVMRRFGPADSLDILAEQNRLSTSLLHALVARIAAFHADAEPYRNSGGGEALAAIAAENNQCLRAAAKRSAAIPEAEIWELHDATRQWLQRLRPLLDKRSSSGKVRRCHGDLHLRNICVADGAPLLFDCLEFSEELATIDVLYDLAFLLMDLRHRKHPGAANLVFNRYLDLTENDDGLAAMPLFLSLRAAIRAHVTALEDVAAPAEARDYVTEAIVVLRPPPPRLVAIGGLSGTGKSTVAAALAGDLGAAPGARILRSDVIRKRLLGVEPEARLPEAAYSAAASKRVYETICSRAPAALRAGYCIIIDAVALREEERHSFAELARRERVPFTGLWLEGPVDALKSRVSARIGDASDATSAIVERQLLSDPGVINWHKIAAGGAIDATIGAAREAIGLPLSA
jgi:uncharacterized protein